jgi:hypothetical protein
MRALAQNFLNWSARDRSSAVELFAIAGPPDCRAAYEKNSKEAEDWASYRQELVDHPERGGQGTGEDPESRKLSLQEALKAVAWRRELLESLDV